MTAARHPEISPQMWALMSPFERLVLDEEGFAYFLSQLSDAHLAALASQWEGWFARPSQCEPEGDWREWLLLTGRGFGKTRTCAEWCYKRVQQGSRAGFILGRTTEQTRDIQVLGPDGLLAIAKRHGSVWEYKSSSGHVVTHTGSTFKMHTSEKPDSVRGPTYDCLVAGTSILMADGSTKPIEDVEVGDLLTTRFGARRVLELFRKEKPCVRIEMQDGRVIEGAEGHRILAGHGPTSAWVALGSILEAWESECAAVAQSSRASVAASTVDLPARSSTRAHQPFGTVDDVASSSTREDHRRTATTARKERSTGSGRKRTGRFLKASSSTTGTTTTGTTVSRTSNSSLERSTRRIIETALSRSLAGVRRLRKSRTSARNAASPTSVSHSGGAAYAGTARTVARGVSSAVKTGTKATYDFTVEGVHEYTAQGFVHHNTGWIEEFATLKSMVGEDGMTAFDNARFTLRATGGLQPRMVMATTPKRTKAVKKMLLEAKDPAKKIVLTRGSLVENIANLAASFREGILDRYAGTALGKQEIDGELATDVEGSVFKSEMFDGSRIEDVRDLPALLRPILAIDPSVGDGTGDECGMTVQAVSAGTIPTEMKHGNLSVIRNVKHGYVLDDVSMAGDPDAWANKAVETCEKYGILEVVAEGNNGGKIIASLLKARNPSLRVRIVHARVGKEARATPVAGLFSQKRWHLVGEFPDMEDQCTTFVPGSGSKSPDRMDSLVWGATHLEPSVGKRPAGPATSPDAYSQTLG